MSNRLAIFDCDGTLVDSQANIVRAMADCFLRAGLDAPCPERTRRVVGLSLVEAMEALLPHADADLHRLLAEDYKHAFRGLVGNGLVDEPLYEGVKDLIDTLEADGWLLGVATGKSDRGLQRCLDHHSIHARFVTLQTADRHPSKPHPSMIAQAMADAGAAPEMTLMIGDTSFDMIMARAAGVTALGVGWGYHPEEELVGAGAHYVAGHPSDIVQFVKAFA